MISGMTLDEKEEALDRLMEQYPGDMGIRSHYESIEIQRDLERKTRNE